MSGHAAVVDAMLERVDTASDRLAIALSRFAAFVTLPALMIFVSVDVAMRYLFDSPIRWASDANGLLLLLTIFSALPHAWDRGYHIRMEMLYGKLRGRKRRLADVAAATVGMAFFIAVAVQAFRFAPYMARTGETGQDLLIPVWPFMAYLGFCALLLAARLLGNPEMRSAEAPDAPAIDSTARGGHHETAIGRAPEAPRSDRPTPRPEGADPEDAE